MSSVFTIDRLALQDLIDDIRNYADGIPDGEDRNAFTRITGLVLPAPGDRVSWTSARDGSAHFGTIDVVLAGRDGFTARVEEDRTVERPHRTTWTVLVDDLTYHTGCATVGTVATGGAS